MGQPRGSSLSVLSTLSPESPFDAALLFRRTGVLIEGWTKSSTPQDVLTVMAATMFGSVQTMVEALGDTSPLSVVAETDQRRILAVKVGAQEELVFVAPKSVSEGLLRQAVRKMLRREPPRVPDGPPSCTPVEAKH